MELTPEQFKHLMDGLPDELERLDRQARFKALTDKELDDQFNILYDGLREALMDEHQITSFEECTLIKNRIRRIRTLLSEITTIQDEQKKSLDAK